MDGGWFRLDGAKLYTMARSRPRMIISAFGPQAAEIAGKYGGGLWTLGDPQTAPGIIDAYRKSCARHGTDPGEIVLQAGFHLGEPEAAVIKATKKWKTTQFPEYYRDDRPRPRRDGRRGGAADDRRGVRPRGLPGRQRPAGAHRPHPRDDGHRRGGVGDLPAGHRRPRPADVDPALRRGGPAGAARRRRRRRAAASTREGRRGRGVGAPASLAAMLEIRGAADLACSTSRCCWRSAAPPPATRLTWRARLRDDDGFVWRATAGAARGAADGVGAGQGVRPARSPRCARCARSRSTCAPRRPTARRRRASITRTLVADGVRRSAAGARASPATLYLPAGPRPRRGRRRVADGGDPRRSRRRSPPRCWPRAACWSSPSPPARATARERLAAAPVAAVRRAGGRRPAEAACSRPACGRGARRPGRLGRSARRSRRDPRRVARWPRRDRVVHRHAAADARFDAALHYATRHHARQLRKGTPVPYAAPSARGRVARARDARRRGRGDRRRCCTTSSRTAAARRRWREIEAAFGPAVADIVLANSDTRRRQDDDAGGGRGWYDAQARLRRRVPAASRPRRCASRWPTSCTTRARSCSTTARTATRSGRASARARASRRASTTASWPSRSSVSATASGAAAEPYVDELRRTVDAITALAEEHQGPDSRALLS